MILTAPFSLAQSGIPQSHTAAWPCGRHLRSTGTARWLLACSTGHSQAVVGQQEAAKATKGPQAPHPSPSPAPFPALSPAQLRPSLPKNKRQRKPSIATGCKPGSLFSPSCNVSAVYLRDLLAFRYR